MSQSQRNHLLALVKADIHFDTLYEQASQAATTYGGQLWTDHGEHDPGVTFLEGYSYSTSDLAYRETLPLVDLLTPPVNQQTPGDGIFPADFGPQMALTCGPITLQDYRKTLLDLTDSANNSYLFRDVQFVLLKDVSTPTAASYPDYWYYFNSDNLEFSFVVPTPADGSTPVDYWLRGNYALYLELMSGVTQDIAQPVLNDFLTNNRNLCESISQIRWMTPQEINPRSTIELKPGVQDIAGVYAALYSATAAYITPTASHASTSELLNQGASVEDIYEGPYLAHGWQSTLPPQTDYTKKITVQLAGLAEEWMKVDGVKSIYTIGTSSSADNDWSWTTGSAETYPCLWGSDPIKRMIDKIRLVTSDGTYVTATATDVEAKLAPQAIEDNPPVVLPYGRPRNVAQYHPVSDKIPPCYSLQQLSVNGGNQALYQFLLPFEQALANGCQLLSMLPQLLAFERTGSTVWGAQWPYASGSIGDQVHATYKSDLLQQITAAADDYNQELRILNHLLGYFGAEQAAQMLDTSADDFLQVEQDYLGQITTLAYHRDNIRVDEVSALQKRIAARMGLGPELFADSGTVDMGSLPFYLVEHRQLLPTQPDPIFNSPIYPVGLAVSVDNKTLTVTCPPNPPLDTLKPSQLIDFVIPEGASGNYTLQALIVDQVDVASSQFTLQISANPQLQIHLQQVLDAWGSNTLYWENCDVWMREIEYPLVYSQDTVDPPVAPVTLMIAAGFPFPAGVQKDDVLQIRSIEPVSGGSWVLKVTVNAVDGLARTLSVSPVAGETNVFPSPTDVANYTWHNTSTADPFSMVVSLVLDWSMLPANGDIYATQDWILHSVQAELPAHVALMVHWLSDNSNDPQSFQSFAQTYATWQNSQTTASTATYQLLWKLGLGVLPAFQTGIGTMIIATPDQQTAVIGSAGDQWNIDVIIEDSLFFVPKNAPTTQP